MENPKIDVHCTGGNCPLNDTCLRHKYFRLGGKFKEGMNVIAPTIDEDGLYVYCEYYYSEITADILTKYPLIVHEN